MLNKGHDRVLLVDDDLELGRGLAHVLSSEGFICDRAANGTEASAMLAETDYDVLVTDLRMPILNGHALSVATLRKTPRPLVVILTAVIEPRLAADLLIRGVDDVLFKPVSATHLATKLKALLVRRKVMEPYGRTATTVSAADLEARLADVRYALPVSQVALEVIRLTGTEEASMSALAEVLSRDPSLTVEVLRLANSHFYAGSAAKTTDIEQAIVRIGTRRLAEIAAATSALVGIAGRRFTWLDTSLLWRQSAAAGIAMSLLLEHAHLSDHGGLFVSALTHDLGRIVLGTLYPGIYELLARSCAASGETLLVEEDRCFPSRHCEVMASILSKWGFPATVFQPLRHSLSGYEALSNLGEPLRTKVELCKAAAFLGRLAVGRFEAWDLVEPIPGSVLARLNVRACRDLVSRTRANLARIDDAGKQPTTSDSVSSGGTAPPNVGYVSLASRRGDFLPGILESLGLAVEEAEPECLATDRYVVVNCLDVPAKRLVPYIGSGLFADTRLIVTDSRHLDDYKSLGTAVSVPASCAALRAACDGVARAQLAKHERTQSQGYDFHGSGANSVRCPVGRSLG
ncbi:MAG TPA: HDOD domain-containing protein [Pirellulales bacterium]|nr:HDOD domain-containing protein [Pirellulales bacterium]